MTGAVDWATLQWILAIISAVVGAAIVAVGMMWRVAALLAAELAKRDKAIEELERHCRLADEAMDARAKMAEQEIARELNAQRLYAAEHFATHSDLASSLGDIKASIEKLGDRLDRFLSGVSAPEPRPGRRG